jgi:hypothetical protein
MPGEAGTVGIRGEEEGDLGGSCQMRPGNAGHAMTRKLALLYLGNKCSKCGISKYLEIHHRDGDWRNDDPDNLELLCIYHHKAIYPQELADKIRELIYSGVKEEQAVLTEMGIPTK